VTLLISDENACQPRLGIVRARQYRNHTGTVDAFRSREMQRLMMEGLDDLFGTDL
jgi:hypothetical protein